MKIPFLSVTIAVSIGVGLGFGAYKSRTESPTFLIVPALPLSISILSLKPMKSVLSLKANAEKKLLTKPNASLKDSKKNLPR